MTAPVVAVLDYGSGNIHSAVKALAAAGADARLTADRGLIRDAAGLVVPGVGAFSAVIEALRAIRGDELIGRRLAGGLPVLGICVGMQVLFEDGIERGVDTEGLGEWPGVVRIGAEGRHGRDPDAGCRLGAQLTCGRSGCRILPRVASR